MSYRTFSLRTLLIAVTVAAISIWAYPNSRPDVTPNAWKSGLRDSEIRSAIVEEPTFTNGVVIGTHTLTKRDAIKFVRLLETCPLREPDECCVSCLPPPTTQFPDMSEIELKLSKERTLYFALLFDCVRTRKELIDISSSQEEINALLWQTK